MHQNSMPCPFHVPVNPPALNEPRLVTKDSDPAAYLIGFRTSGSADAVGATQSAVAAASVAATLLIVGVTFKMAGSLSL